MRTTWTGVPDDLRQTATPLVDAHKRLLPGWVQRFHIRYSEDMTDAYAEISSEQDYGRVTLTFGSGWLNSDAPDRDWTIRHELSHPLLAPLERVFESVLLALPKNARAAWEKDYGHALEESVSNIAYALVKETD